MNRQSTRMRREIAFLQGRMTFLQGRMTLPQSGMTLIEMLITISLLGGVMASTLTLYSNIMKANHQRDSIATMIADADQVLSIVEQDIRKAATINPDYALAGTYTVIAAFPRAKDSSVWPQTIVYAFDASQPRRLLRINVTDDVHVTELATDVKSFTMLPAPNTLINVELTLEKVVAGETKTWQTSTAFSTLALKYKERVL